jgi:flagellar FliL protein
VNKSSQIALTPQKIILIGLLLLALFALTTMGIITLMLKNQEKTTGSATTTLEGTGPKYSLDDFSVNLADQDNRRYLKATVTLELSTAKVAAELDKREAQIRDITITVLRNQTASDLKAGTAAVTELKRQLQNKINSVLDNGEVTAVFFPEFIVQ